MLVPLSRQYNTLPVVDDQIISGIEINDRGRKFSIPLSYEQCRQLARAIKIRPYYLCACLQECTDKSSNCRVLISLGSVTFSQSTRVNSTARELCLKDRLIDRLSSERFGTVRVKGPRGKLYLELTIEHYQQLLIILQDESICLLHCSQTHFCFHRCTDCYEVILSNKTVKYTEKIIFSPTPEEERLTREVLQMLEDHTSRGDLAIAQ